MKRAFLTSVGHAFRRTALPLAAYYAVTLALPLANGAARSGSFVRHALVVLAIPPIVIVLACGVSAIVQLARLILFTPLSSNVVYIARPNGADHDQPQRRIRKPYLGR
jgi:hypothetical protein